MRQLVPVVCCALLSACKPLPPKHINEVQPISQDTWYGEYPFKAAYGNLGCALDIVIFYPYDNFEQDGLGYQIYPKGENWQEVVKLNANLDDAIRYGWRICEAAAKGCSKEDFCEFS